jgi:hypothetical protein
MKHAEYKYLTDTLSGRRQRDPEFEAKMSEAIDPRAEERQRQLDARTPEEREIEQRQYSLRTYGREHMRRYARAIVSEKPLGELQVPGDQIVNASSQQLKGHSEKSTPQNEGLILRKERPGPWRDANGKLRLQNHAACPQRQVLQLI